MAASVTIFLLALGVLYNNYTEFIKEMKLLYDTLSIVQILAVSYFFFNAPSQIAQGITCTHHGGHANEFGIRFVFDIIPTFYCKNSWENIKGKSGRFWALFTPSYYALLLASLGMLCWKITSPGLGLHKLGIILVVIGTIHAAIRLNALWPTDASHILANGLGIPAFQRRAISVAKSWFLRRSLPEPLTSRDKQLFKWYGLLAVSVILITITVGGYLMSELLIRHFNGIGALVLFFGITLSYRKSFFQWFKQMKTVQWITTKDGNAGFISKKLFRWILIAIIVLLLFVPYPYKSGGFFRFLPIEHVEVSTQVDGEIKNVLAKEGDWVTEGQIIALLDTREHQKNLDVSQADLNKTKADLRLMEAGPKPEEIEKARQQVAASQKHYEYSKREAERFKALYEADIISEKEYLSAAKQADVDAENLEVSRSHLDLVKSGARPEEIEAQKAIVSDLETKLQFYRENISLTKLISPISGQVVTPYIESKVGKVLEKGDLFAIIQDARTILAEVQLPEADIGEVKLNARVKIRPWAYSTRFFYGRVVSIAPKVDETETGKVVRVLSEVPNPNLELKPDMTGEAKIEGKWKPFIIAFTRPIVRFFTVEVWSWFP